MSMAPVLKLRNVGKSYADTPVVAGVSFQLARGSIGCLLGPSGCGKTTLLRLIAGFDPVSAGEIAFNGATVSTPRQTVPPERRQIGMVFQDYALFPHLDVQGNIGFGLRHRDKAGRAARVAELLESVGLAGYANALPHELSGGQQQRVALARALAPRPELLLLDEPFSNLDMALRERLGQELRQIIRHEGTTAILVTHDQHEAFAMADEIGVMHRGRIAQWDSAYRLYHEPADRFVADFIGQGVLLPGTVLNPHQIEIELGILDGAFPTECAKGCPVDVLIRPDDIVHDDAAPLRAEVAHKAFRGASILYTLRLPSGGTALSLVPSHHNHALGERIGIRLDTDHVVAFKRI
jgi:iron(III) transport system ATP-binding protein